MELEVSAWTRRDRLERIAAAERDRRAGRTSLALAVLGEGSEWPARLVLALAKLPEDEGAEARQILEASLDDWAAESGLAALAPDAVAGDADSDEEGSSDVVEDALVVDAVEALEEDLLVPATPIAAPNELEAESTAVSDVLAAPIELDELERAFAEAEAQTDEMHGVNDVAERVLMDEPIGLAELDGLACEASDSTGEEVVEPDSVGSSGPGKPAEIAESEGIETDAAWAEAPVWPEPIAHDPPSGTSAIASAAVGREDLDVDAEGGPPTRSQVIRTLERWLDNLQAERAR